MVHIVTKIGKYLNRGFWDIGGGDQTRTPAFLCWKARVRYITLMSNESNVSFDENMQENIKKQVGDDFGEQEVGEEYLPP